MIPQKANSPWSTICRPWHHTYIQCALAEAAHSKRLFIVFSTFVKYVNITYILSVEMIYIILINGGWNIPIISRILYNSILKNEMIYVCAQFKITIYLWKQSILNVSVILLLKPRLLIFIFVFLKGMKLFIVFIKYVINRMVC